MIIYFENQYLKYLLTEKTKKRDEFSSEWDQTDKILYGVILKEFDRSESELLRNNFVGLPKNNIFHPYATTQFYIMSFSIVITSLMVSFFTSLKMFMARRFWIRLLDMETKGVHTINPMAKKLFYDSIDVEIIRRMNAIDLEKKVRIYYYSGHSFFNLRVSNLKQILGNCEISEIYPSVSLPVHDEEIFRLVICRNLYSSLHSLALSNFCRISNKILF